MFYFLRRPFLWISGGHHRGRYYYRPLVPPLSQPSRYCRCFLFRPYYYCALTLISTFNPSYTELPSHYSSLRDAALKSNRPGRGNLRNEKVFIAAGLYDPSGELARGHWGSSVLQLIHLLGKDNVFLSIYENDSGREGEIALNDLAEDVMCNKSIVFEDHLDLHGLRKINTPEGTENIKRITYLAEARNRALQPLDKSVVYFDKLLYLNDVAFNPVDALQLLFSTNINEHGKAQYRAACAVDFINPFKFYDTYATRDSEGYSMGLPFFPWFSDSGSGQSRKAVLSGTDAVPVRSCWGVMTAFDAQFLQKNIKTEPEVAGKSLPARFRTLQDVNLFWDASECCLIHADIQPPLYTTDQITEITGIYINPFLFSFLHNAGNHLVGLPWYNPRREIPGQRVEEAVFAHNGNQTVERVTGHDGFCGRKGLQVIVGRGEEKKGWKTIPMGL
ncbi:cryptococcal mannosyltransferase 1-domain-containing protein [Aspergillus californicus]